jgi:outer membrane lipoprotein-sorting protein
MIKVISFLLLFHFAAFAADSAKNQQASELEKKTEANLRGDSMKGQLEMQVQNKGSTRTIKFDFWSKGQNMALIKVLEPVKETNSGNLRIDLNLWRYLANVDRIIKVPPSMMLQSWMGSDFSYDDMVKTSSMYKDYTHQFIELNNGIMKIECVPKPNSPVVWGKVIDWIQKKDLVTVKREFYSEKGKLLKTMTTENIKAVGSHRIPMKMTMTNHQKEGLRTVLEYKKVEMDIAFDESIFSQQKLKERR